jgi:hypothetical protein
VVFPPCVFSIPTPLPAYWVQHAQFGFWLPAPTQDSLFHPRTTWLALTLTLIFLLLISTGVNVSLFLGSRAERNRHLDGDYVYHPLQEVNGEALTAEKEHMEETSNPFKD